MMTMRSRSFGQVSARVTISAVVAYAAAALVAWFGFDGWSPAVGGLAFAFSLLAIDRLWK
jgi:hypothetical protein